MSNGDLTVSYKYEDKRFKHGNETSELENETSELEEETSKHAWTKRPNIHHCAKVIGISKKTQFERMFLFQLQFFRH